MNIHLHAILHVVNVIKINIACTGLWFRRILCPKKTNKLSKKKQCQS